MKKILFYILLIWFFMLFYFVIPSQAKDNKYFIRVNNQQEVNEVVSQTNGELISYEQGVATIKLKAAAGSDLKAKQIVTINGEKKYLEQDSYYTLSSLPVYQNEDYYNSKDDFNSINWYTAYNNNKKGKGAVVAIIDSGCNLSHQDLSGQIIGTYNAVDGTSNVTDYDGHGTHVAGIIAAKDNTVGTIGVAPEAKLYIIKAESNDGLLYYSDIIKGLNKCIELGNINVINMSFGGWGYSENMRDAIIDCVNHGILPVCAAGNEGINEVNYPAAFGYGLSVGSYDSIDSELSYFSNYGSSVNILAPGYDVYSSYLGKKGYEYLSGTSMSTPYVSGAAALVYGNKKFDKSSTGTSQVKNIILAARNSKIYKNSFGGKAYGGLNIGRLFNLSNKKTPTPTISYKIDKYTKRCKVSLKGNGTIYYCIDGCSAEEDGVEYTKSFWLDKPNYIYEIQAICIDKRGMSEELTEEIKVPKDAISIRKEKSIELYIKKINNSKIYKVKPGQRYNIQIENIGKKINLNRFKWSSNNEKVLVDKNGKITVKDNVRAGTRIVITGTIGTIKKELDLIVK